MWILKLGLYELNRVKEKAEDWVLIVDFSIQLGKDKVLLIYGIRQKEIPFGRSLKCTDLQTLHIESKESWKKEDVSKVLKDLKSKLGTIKYVVSDGGCEIVKGLAMAEIKHTYDLTHALALITERILRQDKNYMEVTSELSKMQIALSQTDAAHLIPLKQRKKSHYQNIKRIADYLAGLSRYVKEERYTQPRVVVAQTFLSVTK